MSSSPVAGGGQAAPPCVPYDPAGDDGADDGYAGAAEYCGGAGYAGDPG